MPYVLEDLVVDRVDLVDEGANSAAFVELYKGKETRHVMDAREILSKMKPEHATVIEETINKAKEDLAKAQGELTTVTSERDALTQELNKAKEDLKTANDDLEATKSELEVLKGKTTGEDDGVTLEDEILKSMPEAVRQQFEKMKAQKDAAEEELRKAKDAEATADALAKARELKAIPVDEDKLVGIIKSASSEVLDLLTTVNAAIEGTVLNEVGKSHVNGPAGTTDANAAWAKIEAKADEVAKRDNITKAKAVSVVIKECPELYTEYLQGGAN